MADEQIKNYSALIQEYILKNHKKMFREPEGNLKYRFIVPGSGYSNQLWDWDSWLTDIALSNMQSAADVSEYEKGCILNFLDFVDDEGRMPILIMPNREKPKAPPEKETNIHKPMLAQHALFISRKNGDFEWLRQHFEVIERYLHFYIQKCKHKTGLFYWLDDRAIGVDNDPCTFYRPPCSSGSVFLNCLMYKEFCAVSEIAKKLGLDGKAGLYMTYAEDLKNAIQTHCWDERDGFFYSVDFNLLPIDPNSWLHKGAPRHWDCLIQRIGVWSGFLAMWAGMADKEQAERMVREHLLNEKTFNAPYGVRTLSKQEKMYAVVASGNPSCWLGPVWGISNYLTFSALLKYGFTDEARDLAEKTIILLGKDLETCGEFHEYYHPETGEPMMNPGFQNWNLLVLNMIAWIENRPVVSEV